MSSPFSRHPDYDENHMRIYPYGGSAGWSRVELKTFDYIVDRLFLRSTERCQVDLIVTSPYMYQIADAFDVIVPERSATKNILLNSQTQLQFVWDCLDSEDVDVFNISAQMTPVELAMLLKRLYLHKPFETTDDMCVMVINVNKDL